MYISLPVLILLYLCLKPRTEVNEEIEGYFEFIGLMARGLCELGRGAIKFAAVVAGVPLLFAVPLWYLSYVTEHGVIPVWVTSVFALYCIAAIAVLVILNKRRDAKPALERDAKPALELSAYEQEQLQKAKLADIYHEVWIEQGRPDSWPERYR